MEISAFNHVSGHTPKVSDSLSTEDQDLFEQTLSLQRILEGKNNKASADSYSNLSQSKEEREVGEDEKIDSEEKEESFTLVDPFLTCSIFSEATYSSITTDLHKEQTFGEATTGELEEVLKSLQGYGQKVKSVTVLSDELLETGEMKEAGPEYVQTHQSAQTVLPAESIGEEHNHQIHTRSSQLDAVASVLAGEELEYTASSGMNALNLDFSHDLRAMSDANISGSISSTDGAVQEIVQKVKAIRSSDPLGPAAEDLSSPAAKIQENSDYVFLAEEVKPGTLPTDYEMRADLAADVQDVLKAGQTFNELATSKTEEDAEKIIFQMGEQTPSASTGVSRSVLTGPHREASLSDYSEQNVKMLEELVFETVTAHPGKNEFTSRLTLTPKTLGQVTVEMKLDEEGLSGRLIFDSEEARNWLENNWQELKLPLESKGLNLNHFDFVYAESTSAESAFSDQFSFSQGSEQSDRERQKTDKKNRKYTGNVKQKQTKVRAYKHSGLNGLNLYA
ncbi:hypothetical protein ADIAL_1972 [Alkalibacterium sp. AK22]|uniref:flagellar hook-length control protein FliK n=1 Tax=Alkalibacterium sp. AK22 TaxID=1229520 RepID=UPI00045149C3|nr:flagellar hook-length control protein FliK [Alkalibacterium sp. AK22]EXJ22386.1 hypothetical protein ADIAL_1972 [Alkalibacterium sp. AK22]